MRLDLHDKLLVVVLLSFGDGRHPRFQSLMVGGAPGPARTPDLIFIASHLLQNAM